MPPLLLSPHPDFSSGAVAQIEVKVARPSVDRVVLSYIVTGEISSIRMRPIAAANRGDELWRHTCFEIFARTSSGLDYYEFNFAPSTQWAAYRFNGYRSGMSVAAEIDAASIETHSSPDRFTLQAAIPIDRLSALSRNTPWRLGLSAVIEDKTGHMSYWALAHPPGKPDFHHMDCFAYEFSPAVSA
jgi:hypothetical protein